MSKRQGPVLIELDETDAPETPATAPPVPETAEPPDGAAMRRIVQLGSGRPSRLARLFWSVLGALISVIVSVALWDFVTGLLSRNSLLGGVALGLTGILMLILLVIALREWAAFARLSRIDRLQRRAGSALADADLGAARQVADDLTRLYAGRASLDWGLSRFEDRRGDMFDADALLGLAENEILAPLDEAAIREVESASRQVAAVTALVPLALADLIAALTANLRMIRRIAELYGGRAGTLGSWRLTRSVLTHLVATGAVAVGDDLLGPLAGGGILGKLSRRFGEGMVNGALTARVGVAAIEVCRPLPFRTRHRPSVLEIIRRALTGLFGSENG